MLVANMHIIGNKLYEIRKRSGLTRAEVAERANLSDRTYADIERGSSKISLGVICKALQMPINVSARIFDEPRSISAYYS